MPNLNHGSGPLRKPPGWTPPGATVDVGDQITAYIDAALERKRAAQPPRQYIGASELGEECLRKLFYNATNAPRRPFTGQKLRIFDMGHGFEDLMVGWLKDAGFKLLDKSPKTGRQFEFITGNGRVKGHSDGVIVAGPTIPGLTYPVLWENKALKADFWNRLVKVKLQEFDSKYWAQCHLYMGYFDLAACLFTALNKNTGEIYYQLIPYQVAEAQKYSDRAVSLIRAVDMNVVPPRVAGAKGPDFFKCRFCDFPEHCWSQQ